MLEHICQLAPRGSEAMFYRTAAGTEIDVVVQSGGHTICFEIKSSSAPKVTQGFHNALHDLKPTRTYIVPQVDNRYAFAEHIDVIPLTSIAETLCF